MAASARNGTSSAHGQRIYVFDSPRSVSQTFHKLFSGHPQLTQLHHPLMACTLYGPERLQRRFQHKDATEQRQNELAVESGFSETETYDVAVERLEETVEGIVAAWTAPDQ